MKHLKSFQVATIRAHLFAFWANSHVKHAKKSKLLHGNNLLVFILTGENK